jgi:hypothetical protein
MIKKICIMAYGIQYKKDKCSLTFLLMILLRYKINKSFLSSLKTFGTKEIITVIIQLLRIQKIR